MPVSTRRTFIKRSAASAAVLSVGACGERAEHLSPANADLLELIADAIVPGAKEAGVAAFIDAMLKSANPTSAYKLFGYPAPMAVFYTESLEAFARHSIAATGHAFGELDGASREALILTLADPAAPPWSEPPSFLFYLLIRNDAVDVVYGAEAAYAAVQAPYMAHIEPTAVWPR